jgi:hypothetical protein
MFRKIKAPNGVADSDFLSPSLASGWHNLNKFGPMCRPFVAMMEYESACFLFSSFDFGILKMHIYCDLSAFFIISPFKSQRYTKLMEVS